MLNSQVHVYQKPNEDQRHIADWPSASSVGSTVIGAFALRNIAKKWTMSVHDWKAALNRFAIVYEDRLPVE